jgi:uncharacterized membrane protein
VHPFSLREALLAKHAQHVVLIHFPIALFVTGVALDFAASWTKRGGLAAAAYCNFLVAAMSTPLVVATGLLAWQLQLEGQKLKGPLLQHLVLGVASSVMIGLVWYVHFRSRRTPGQTLPSYRLPIELVAAGLVAMAAHIGGYLSGVNIPS